MLKLNQLCIDQLHLTKFQLNYDYNYINVEPNKIWYRSQALVICFSTTAEKLFSVYFLEALVCAS